MTKNPSDNNAYPTFVFAVIVIQHNFHLQNNQYGLNYTDEQIKALIEFKEKFFKSDSIRYITKTPET